VSESTSTIQLQLFNFSYSTSAIQRVVSSMNSYDQKIEAARKFSASKALGQNFLIDDDKLTAVCSAVHLSKDDHVLEIGPGLGFLTELLDAAAAQVLAVELDIRCVRYLETLKLLHTKIVHADILRYKIDPAAKPLKVAGNIPYQITAPILVHMLGEIGAPSPWFNQLERMVFTIQREVAQRLTASPGSKDYGQITLLLNYFAAVEIVTDIPASCFYPSPEVDSSVITITPWEKPAVECNNPKTLRSVIVAGFSRRRKMLRNNLMDLFSANNCTRAFERLNLDPQSRAENLSLNQYSQLADELAAGV
jgi:16S rRNA (adenine1518-N6/adenine1519-N6)-dimethyltransferase